MNTMVENAEAKADKSEAILALLDDETRKLLRNFPGSGERGGLIEADYHKIIDILLEKTGKVPTQHLVAKATGGSNTYVGPALRTWKKDFEHKAHAVEEKEIAPIPEALAQVTSELITNAVQQIGGKIWEASATFHSKAIEAERQVMQGDLARAERSISEADQAADAINEELKEALAKQEQTNVLLEDEKKRVLELADQVDTLKSEVASERGRAQEIERERDNERAENARLAGALLQSEGEVEKFKALLQAAEQRFETSEANARQAREDAEKRLNDLRANLENERSKAAADREAAARREQSAASEIDGLKKERTEFKRALDAGRDRAERDVAEAKAEAKRALAEQSAAFEDRLNAAKQTVASLSDQIAMLKKHAEKPKADSKQGDKLAGSTDKAAKTPAAPAVGVGEQRE